MKERKKQIEHKLGKLGVNVEKMQEASDLLERPYCHTKEREEKDKEEELKRKAEEEAAECKSKKVKVIPLVKGKVAPEMIHEDIPVEEEEEEENYENKVKRQQKEIIQKQEILLQTAESQLMSAQQTIATQERMLKEHEYMNHEQNVKEGQPSPSTSTYRVGGTYMIDKFLKLKALSFLKGKEMKKEKVEVADDDDDQVIIVEDEVLEQKQVFRYVPKVVPEVENLVLVPTQPKKSTKLHTLTLGPVHEKLQDPRKFYCNRCPSEHKRKDEIA